MADLLGWLGQRAKAVEAQVNPFDNGRTYNTVRQGIAPRPIPQSPTTQAIRGVAQSPFAVPQFAAGSSINALRALAGFATANHLATNNAIKGLGQNYDALANVPRQFVTRPAVQLATSLAPKQLTVRPTNAASRVLLGNTPVQNIEKGVASNYNAHPGLNPIARVGLAGAYGAGQVAQDIPVALGALKGAKVAAKFDAAQNQVGAVGKNVKLSPDEIKNLQKQGFDQKTISKMAGPQGETVKAPSAPSIPKSNYGNIIPQTSSEGRLTKLTSIQNRLNKLGETGPRALQAFRNTQVSERMNLQQFRNATKPFNDLTPAEQEVARQVHQGTGTSTNPAINAGAKSLTNFYSSIIPKAKALDPNWKVGNLGKNYFPEMAPKEWLKNKDNFNKVAQDMVNSGKASNLQDAASKINKISIQDSTKPTEFGNFKPREKNIESPIPAGEAHNAYMKGVAKRFAQVEHLGPKNQLLDKLKAEAVTKGEDAGALSKAMSAVTNPEKAKPGAVTTGLNAYQKGLRVLQLPRAAISHGPQGLANTASDVGYKNYFHALGNKIFKDPEVSNLEAKSGINSESFGKSGNVSDKATAPGLGRLIDFHRRVAFRGGVYFAKDAAKKGDTEALGRMGVDGAFAKNADGSIKLTDTQLIKAGHFEADKSIGSHSNLESPAWIGSNKGKAIGMYRKMYVFKQAERIAGLFGDAKNGNVAPLARYLAVGVPLSGVAIAAAKNEIKNPGSNPIGNPKTFAGQALYNSGGLSLGYGAADSAYNAITHNYGNNSRWANAGAAVSPGLGFGIQTGQNIDKAARGSSTALKREGFGFLPAGGTALANKFAPNKPFLTPDTTGKAPDSPQQREVNAKAEKKQLEANPNVGNGYGLQKLSNGQYAYWLDGDSKPSYTSDLKTAQTAVGEAQFKAEGISYKTVGDTVYRKAADGTVSKTTKTKFDYQIGTATLTAQKNAGDLNGWLDTAHSQLDSIAKQLQDPSIDPLDALTLQNDATALQDGIDKYTGYGGFTKPKTPKKASSATSSFKTTGTAKIAKPKGVSVRKLAAPSFKAPKTTKLAVSKIPVVSSRRKA